MAKLLLYPLFGTLALVATLLFCAAMAAHLLLQAAAFVLLPKPSHAPRFFAAPCAR